MARRARTGVDAVVAELRGVDIAAHCVVSGVDEALVRRAARRIGSAASVAVAEDLGIQMNLHSTLVSYLEKLVWLLTGNLAGRNAVRTVEPRAPRQGPPGGGHRRR